MTKGPPAAYPLLLLLGLAALDRRWDVLRRWLTSGAPLTIALIGLPWFVYLMRHPLAGQAAVDLRNSALGGEGHIRVTYGTRAENDRFLAALDEALAAAPPAAPG